MPRRMKWRRDGTSDSPKGIDLRLAGIGRVQLSSGVYNREAYTIRVNALREDAGRGGVWGEAVRALKAKRFDVPTWYAARSEGEKGISALLDRSGAEPLSDTIRDYLKQSSAGDKKKMRQRLNRFAKSLGKKPSLADVTTANIETFLSELIDERTAKTTKTKAEGSTANRYRAVIGGLCTWAVNTKRMREHPIAGRQVPKRPEPHHRLPEMSADEYRDYMAFVREQRPDLAVVFLLLIHTAPDVGEVFSRTARDVSLDAAQITYQRTKTKHHATGGLPRKVPMPSVLVTELRAHFAEHDLRGSQPLFSMFKRRDVETLHAAACAVIQRPELTLKDLRHVGAIAWVKAGTHIRTVSKWLGHASLSQTHKYTDFEPSTETASRMAESAAETLNQTAGITPIRRASNG